jgi:hypothetical protein
METGINQSDSKTMQNLFRLLFTSDLIVFIDRRKLHASELFQRATKVAIDQYSAHGNPTQLTNLITLLHGTA